MKIDRVILTTNTDRAYYEFWNNLSFTYKTKFGIQPTLIFFGTECEFKELGLSDEYGDIFFEKPIDNVGNWYYTWALFYYTKFFPNETCLIMGIDQIPLGTYFLKDLIDNVNNDDYIMLIDDHYVKTNQTKYDWSNGGFSPSAYHISKGTTYSNIYNFEDSFGEEIKKIISEDLKTMWNNGWGMDESYSSKKLYEYNKKEIIKCFNKSEELVQRRIECNRIYEPSYNIDDLQNNQYIECHSCRPYHKHKNYLDNLFNNIPKFI